MSDPAVYSQDGEGHAVTPTGEVLRVGDRVWISQLQLTGAVYSIVGEGVDAMLVVKLDEEQDGGLGYAKGGVEMARRMEVA